MPSWTQSRIAFANGSFHRRPQSRKAKWETSRHGSVASTCRAPGRRFRQTKFRWNESGKAASDYDAIGMDIMKPSFFFAVVDYRIFCTMWAYRQPRRRSWLDQFLQSEHAKRAITTNCWSRRPARCCCESTVKPMGNMPLRRCSRNRSFLRCWASDNLVRNYMVYSPVVALSNIFRWVFFKGKLNWQKTRAIENNINCVISFYKHQTWQNLYCFRLVPWPLRSWQVTKSRWESPKKWVKSTA